MSDRLCGEEHLLGEKTSTRARAQTKGPPMHRVRLAAKYEQLLGPAGDLMREPRGIFIETTPRPH